MLASSSREYQPVSRSEGDVTSSGEDDDKRMCKWVSWYEHLQQQLNVYGLPLWRYMIKWCVPGASMMLSFAVQSTCLHIATHYYIDRMMQAENAIVHCSGNVTHSLPAHIMAQGPLRDVAAEVFGRHDIPTNALDLISGFVPALWFVLVVYDLNLNSFSKCCFCGSVLALGKGFLGLATVVPDSGGWSNCKARIGKEGLEWFSHFHLGERSWKPLAALIRFELFGTRNKHIRYCADMIYSGHTYFCMLFALGLYDAWYVSTVSFGAWRWPARRIISLALSCLVILDVVLILMNQFHYTVDVFLALFAVYLFYTNALVARAATWWATELWVPQHNLLYAGRMSATSFLGNVMNPPCFCCLPFCFMSDRYHVRPEGFWSACGPYGSRDRLVEIFLFDHPERFCELVKDSLEWAQSPEKFSYSNALTKRDVRCTKHWYAYYNGAVEDVKRTKGPHHIVSRSELIEHTGDQQRDKYSCGSLGTTLFGSTLFMGNPLE